jgi:hypothetical protein
LPANCDSRLGRAKRENRVSVQESRDPGPSHGNLQVAAFSR